MGPRTPGWKAVAQRKRRKDAPAGSACQPLAAQAQSGHVALPAPGSPPLPRSVRSLLPSGLPKGHLTAPGVPARRTVLDLACHVTESHRRPEVACVTATEIPVVVNVISRAGPESEGRQGFSSHFRGVGLTVPTLAFVKIT